MASNERTRLRRQFRPGKGKYMKPETLQAFLLSAQELRGVELEFSVSHGVAVRASANLSDFSSIQDRPSNLCQHTSCTDSGMRKALNSLPKATVQDISSLIFARMQDLYVTARKNIKTCSDKKTAPAAP